MLVDISSDVRLRKKLEEEASRDFLTGVYNRKGGELLIREKMKHGEPYLFLMLDLDNFKRVNDFYGHEEGDEMLRYMAGLLTGTFRQTDVVIRLGGDEFAVFIQPCYDLEALRRKIERAAEEYRAEALRKYPDSGTSVSIGGICGSRARSFMEMYKLADSVLYEVKHGGKGQCRIREE